MKIDDVDMVIWDWNGTLLDDLWLCLEIANGMLERRGLPTMDADRYRDIFDFPVSEYYRRAGFDFSREPFAKLADEFIGEYNSRVGECKLHSSVDSVIGLIEAGGASNAVLSASEHESLLRAIENAGLLSRFVDVQGIDNHFAVSKVEIGRELMERHKTPRDRVVLVGDTTHDFSVAREMGISAILVATGHQSADKLRQTGAPVVDSLEMVFHS